MKTDYIPLKHILEVKTQLPAKIEKLQHLISRMMRGDIPNFPCYVYTYIQTLNMIFIKDKK